MPSITRSTAADVDEPLTVEELKSQIRADHDDEDVILEMYIRAARQVLEIEYDTALVPTTCVLRLDRFPQDGCYGDIELRIKNVTSVTSIAYTDTNGANQTLSASNYTVNIYDTPALIRPAYGLAWPSTRDVMNAVTVTFVAGYATPDLVPATTKAYLQLLAAEKYDKRELTVTGATIARVPGFESLMISERWGAYRSVADAR